MIACGPQTSIRRLKQSFDLTWGDPFLARVNTSGHGLRRIRIGEQTHLRVVDAILSGTHEPGTSHYELLQAFADKSTLRRADDALESAGYRSHEFGDSVLIERDSRRYSRGLGRPIERQVFRENQGLVGRPATRILRRFAPAPAHVVQESHQPV